MSKPHHSALVTGVLLVSVVVGALALGGSAAALEPDQSSPYPDTVGSTAQTAIGVYANESDAIVEEGLAGMRFDFGVGNFDGSVANITAEDVSILVSREQDGGRTMAARLEAVSVSTEANGERLAVEFDRTLEVQPGDRIAALIENFSTPTEENRYTVEVTAVTPGGAEDGPVGVSYAADRATIQFDNQSASQFGSQNVSLSGVVPSYGYVAVFRADNGTRGDLVGSTEVVPSFDPQNYSVALGGSVTESQELIAVPYYETSGDTLSARREAAFDPAEDEPFSNNDVVVNDTGFVSVLDADGRVAAGSTYQQGARLFFDQGDAGTAYAIRTVADGQPGETVQRFETAENGTAILDTADLDTGQYTIVRLSDDSVLSLDDDDTTGAEDDSFRITPATATTTGATNASANMSNDTATTTDDAMDGTGNGTADTIAPTTETTDGAPAETTDETVAETSPDTTETTADGGDGGSNLPGPGFGIGAALVAVLAVALLAARRRD